MVENQNDVDLEIVLAHNGGHFVLPEMQGIWDDFPAELWHEK